MKKITLNKLQLLAREHAQFPVLSNERQNDQTTEAATFNELHPLTLSSTSPHVWSGNNTTQRAFTWDLSECSACSASLLCRMAMLVLIFVFSECSDSVNISVVHYLLRYTILAYRMVTFGCCILPLVFCIYFKSIDSTCDCFEPYAPWYRE